MDSPILLPEQVAPFLQSDDRIVRDHARLYFEGTHGLGRPTADDYWAVIDRLGENDQTIWFAAELDALPQTDASMHRLVRALAETASEKFEFYYQHAAGNMDLAVLGRNPDKLLACPCLLPHVRERLELRLKLLDEPPALAWDRLMRHGRELGRAFPGEFNTSLSDALIEAAARGGSEIGERAMGALGVVSVYSDWRQSFGVQVLGMTKYQPAVDALVKTLAVDDDFLNHDVNTALARIGSLQVIERIVAFYGGRPWNVRLNMTGPLPYIKNPASVAALALFLEVELAYEARGDQSAGSLIYSRLFELTVLGSLARLDESRRRIAASPNDPEMLELCESLIAIAVMRGVTLPEEADWRARLQARDARNASRSDLDDISAADLELWRKTGISYPRAADDQPIVAASKAPTEDPEIPEDFADPPVPVRPIRNTSPKVGRNDPCPCGSQKKYKKCCGK
jgi:hypothetical protein